MVSVDRPWIPKFYSIRYPYTKSTKYPVSVYRNLLVSCGQEKYTDTWQYLRDGIGVFQGFSRVI